MTKYEWESKLKKGISGLPFDEQKRVLDYYDELFSDKIDAGMKELDIINEFGDPLEVANKVTVNFYNEDKNNPEADAYVFSETDSMDNTSKEEKSENKNKDKVEIKIKKEEKKIKKSKARKEITNPTGLIVLICVLLFFVLGAFFNLWHPGWMLFIAMPLLITLFQSIKRRNWRLFCYPLFVVLLYLIIGFSSGLWHPFWVLFITIPVYYVAGDYISKNLNYKNDDDVVVEVIDNDIEEKEKKTSKGEKGNKSIIAKILLSIVLITLLITIWSVVIGLFIAGISLIGGGLVAIVWSCALISESFSASMMSLGGAITILGLGFIFTFSMLGLFKYCVKLGKDFCNTISNC